jgi:cobaltochelatase CobN
MYERLSAEYVFAPDNADFMRKSNPWALRGITERLLEAADRGLWERPDPRTLERLRETYLALEGDLEGDLEGAVDGESDSEWGNGTEGDPEGGTA